MKASDMVLESQTSILMKGPFGHAKTCAAATFAADGPIWIAYWDKKKPVELQHFFYNIIKRPELLKNIEYDVYNSTNANEYLNRLMHLASDCRYFAHINDSVTNMTSGAVNWSLGFRPTKLKGKDKIMPDFDEYKVETSLVTQALDICKSLPCHIIWTCHPVPSIKIEGTGSSIKVTKVNPIVTYGNKVAGIVPGNFSEIYHFSKQADWNSETGKATTKYIVDTEAVGDDFAKSNLGLKAQFDITNKLFYDVWKEQVKQLQEDMKHAVAQEQSKSINPFDTNPTTDQPTWRV
ncbi:MAG: hypothetical protein ABWY25_06225 [Paenisporosarcina sp.]